MMGRLMKCMLPVRLLLVWRVEGTLRSGDKKKRSSRSAILTKSIRRHAAGL